MKYSQRIMRKRFSANESKVAYLKLCEWLARNVVGKRNEVGSVSFEIEKLKNEEQPTFELSLFVSLEEREIMEQHCKVCKETHKLFYVNENYNCDACREKAYRARMQERINVKASYIKKLLKGTVVDG